jgi:small subunit ribosomal protein S18
MTTETGRPQQRRGRPRYYTRRKVCQFCVDKIVDIDYKDIDSLKRFLSDRFMIEARRKTGVCSKHQRALARAVKRARQLSLIPFTSSHKGSFAINFRPRN